MTVADDSSGALVSLKDGSGTTMMARAVQRLEYEVYKPLAEKEGARILDEARTRFLVPNAVCIHREGLARSG